MHERYGGQTEAEGGELKICVKCKHCFITQGGYMCRRPRPGASVDPVTGETEKLACIKERTEDDASLCGFDAQFWEEMPPLPPMHLWTEHRTGVYSR